nr:UvrD-like helicase, ATP-binding domain, P-loop containing nucleoside triphosphate hydrolase [Tanacetum cinerariifolium]
MSEDLISLRTTDLSVKLLNEIVLGIVVAISDLDYSSIVSAKSSVVAGWFTDLHSTATPTKLSSKPKILT